MKKIFNKELVELNKFVKFLSDKSVEEFGLPMPIYINSDITSAEYTKEKSNDRSSLL